ncbi:glycoside hydrolase family 32 protein [Flagellimonas sp. CMM7]|uniref:glycoside hydrolase family 32 protein n=1 Tax=Flagellimonas sp. CMM7 TaxID=2654676 RepID=UPI0013CFEFFB|nr:glycoside hydrolase family 32 protein [Flagellimonas sp. CMM7]UII81565.1 hypothetical protein LV704_08610 [Flagellimonas sp. CMM7]
MKAAVLISDDYLGSWLNHLNTVFENQEIEIIIIDSPKKSLVKKLALKIDEKFFGKPKSLTKQPIDCNCIFIKWDCADDLLEGYDTIYNTTSLILKNDQFKNIYQFKVSGITNIRDAITYCTVDTHENITLSIDNRRMIFQTSLRPHSFSLSLNTDLILGAFLSLLFISNKKKSHFIKNEDNNQTKKAPTFLEYTKYAKRVIAKTFEKMLFNEQWIIGYNEHSYNNERINENNFKKLIPPKDRFWADPFVVYKNKKYFLFVEELVYKNKKAHLSVIQLNSDGTYSNPIKILEKPYHLSYPFIFDFQGKYYMIPETSANNDIQLYEAVNFPYEWEFKKVLIDNVKASDTTLLAYNNKWWLFTSIKHYDYGTYDNNLAVYYCNDFLNGDWVEHKINPIKQGISNSRQGGGFIKENGQLYRVSQNCSKRYGYGFNLNKVEILTENIFEEEKVYTYTASDLGKIRGIHTYNKLNNGFAVFDVLIKTRKF